MESYPEQCMIDGVTFRNEEQALPRGADSYVGLEEDEALEKASANNVPARVVERDGESLPVTMDFMPGRLNLSVKEGKVSHVRVEGEEN